MKIAFHTLGCKVNSYETEAIWELFEEKGFERIPFKDKADVYVINTCTVTNHGDSKSRKTIRQAVKRNPNAVVAVIGCYAQLDSKTISTIDGVDVIVGTKERQKVVELVEKVLVDRSQLIYVDDIMKYDVFDELHVNYFTENTRAFVKIQDGCNNFCTYCIIPYARGPLRSRDFHHILQETTDLVEHGYKEIVLTGIHTGGYGIDINHSLADLLIALDQINGLERIRISSIEINEITNEIVNIIKNSNKIVHHLHIPLQSGSDTILKKMHRKYDTLYFKERVDYIRDNIKGIAITTDVIVGFPSETPELFEEMKQYIKDISFSELHIFPYSKRNGTPAAKMKDQINGTIKSIRVNELKIVNEQLALAYRNQFLHKNVKVLPETYRDGFLFGHTDTYINVQFPGDESLIGEIVDVTLNEIDYPISYGKLN